MHMIQVSIGKSSRFEAFVGIADSNVWLNRLRAFWMHGIIAEQPWKMTPMSLKLSQEVRHVWFWFGLFSSM